jgi:CHASE3 domain sensor protein
MKIDQKAFLTELIENTEESQLGEVVKAILSTRLAHLQQEHERIARELAATESQLKELTATLEPPSRPTRKPRSGHRVSDIVRQTLRDVRSPLPLDAIAKAVAKATGKPLTNSLRTYVGQLLQREPTIKRLSRGLYAITA